MFRVGDSAFTQPVLVRGLRPYWIVKAFPVVDDKLEAQTVVDFSDNECRADAICQRFRKTDRRTLFEVEWEGDFD